jgi:integrase
MLDPATANNLLDPALPKMSDLIALIRADEGLTASRRANLVSSINRFCGALTYSVSEVPANHWYFRERLKRFHPLEVGLTKKRWQTIKADVSFALKRGGIAKGQPRPFAALSPDWLALKEQLPSQTFRHGLSRLMRYCTVQGVKPTDVSDELIKGYDAAYRRESFKINPDRHLRSVCQLWNKLPALLPELGLQPVTLPSFRESYTAPWETLPTTFREEVDAWLHSLSQATDLLSDEGPLRPLRPASIIAYRYAIRQSFAALVQSGTKPESITSLSTLIQGDNGKAILKVFLDRNGGKSSSMISNIAWVLVLIAKAARPSDPEAVEKLQRYRKKLSVRSAGLRPRPRNALRPFADARNIEKVIQFPIRVHERLSRKTTLTPADARLMQVAVALELLLMRPIRRKNLAALRMGENVVRSGRSMFIVLPSEEVKNKVELDYRIPAESAVLIDFYVKNLLPLFGANPKGWLFPGENPERHKADEQLGRQFTKTIKEATGLSLYPHLTRHLGAFLYLKENPGAFEIVRRVLAHKSLTTTMRSYVGFDDESAVRMFDTVILRIRESINREIQ